MADRLAELSNRGVSIWLDDLSRERLATGSLARLAEHDHVVGVTTTPTIFAKAIADSDAYAAQLRTRADVKINEANLQPGKETAGGGPPPAKPSRRGQ